MHLSLLKIVKVTSFLKGIPMLMEASVKQCYQEMITLPELRLNMAIRNNIFLCLKIPLICDDPLVHFDAKRAKRALKVLKEEVAKEKRQVILFTCHKRTYDHALKLGATTKELW